MTEHWRKVEEHKLNQTRGAKNKEYKQEEKKLENGKKGVEKLLLKKVSKIIAGVEQKETRPKKAPLPNT